MLIIKLFRYNISKFPQAQDFVYAVDECAEPEMRRAVVEISREGVAKITPYASHSYIFRGNAVFSTESGLRLYGVWSERDQFNRYEIAFLIAEMSSQIQYLDLLWLRDQESIGVDADPENE